MTGLPGLAAVTPVSNVPNLSSFGHDPWWLVILKVLIIFLFLMLSTLFMIWAERRVIAGCSSGPGRTEPVNSACCSP